MARSEPRGAGSPPPASDWGRLEAAILSGWRTFWYSVAKERATPTASRKEAAEETSALTRLPVSRGRRPRTEAAAGRGPGPAGQPLPGVCSPGSEVARIALMVTLGIPLPTKVALQHSLMTSEITHRLSVILFGCLEI